MVIRNKKIVFKGIEERKNFKKEYENCTLVIKTNPLFNFDFIYCTFKNCKFEGESEAMESKVKLIGCKVQNCSFKKIRLVEATNTEIDNVTFNRSYFDINW